MFLLYSGDTDIVSHPMGNFKEFCNLTCEKLHIIAIFHGYIDAFDGLAAQKTANSFLLPIFGTLRGRLHSAGGFSLANFVRGARMRTSLRF